MKNAQPYHIRSIPSAWTGKPIPGGIMFVSSALIAVAGVGKKCHGDLLGLKMNQSFCYSAYPCSGPPE
jgi:hypothetical protein